MDTSEFVNHLIHALYLTLWLSLPPIIVASVVGTLFSLFQALTQIQEQTLSFGVKLIATMVTLALTARWVGGELYNYTLSLFDSIARLGR